jgi:hypothetical protein
MTFLNDAYINRGVFRQVGAVYQFRHINLQRRLADSPVGSISSGTVMERVVAGSPDDDKRHRWRRLKALIARK